MMGILIALLGFIDALATSPDQPELQMLQYILAVLGIVVLAIGIAIQEIEKNNKG